MPLHRLTSVTVGVPDVGTTTSYYSDFGLTLGEDGWLSTTDGGRQLRIVPAARRRLIEIRVGVDHSEDLDRAAAALTALGIPSVRAGDTLRAAETVAGFEAVLEIVPRLEQPEIAAPRYNGPGRIERTDARAPAVLRTSRVHPRKLGHVVVGSTDVDVTRRFFTDGLGFRVSDEIEGEGAFLRCSNDHHNVLVLRAPVAFLHHTSWQVDDVDEVGRGAAAMLEGKPERHVWGLGRHHAGSNFFWYLKDPAGNFCEYYSDMDTVVEDQLWTPETLEGAKGLFSWGPPPPPSFLRPDDLAELMAGAHQPG